MSVKVAYEIGIEGEFMDSVISSVYLDLRVPSDVSRAVRIKESVCPADVDAPIAECGKKSVSDAVLIVEERV
jgi:hypothetical protein